MRYRPACFDERIPYSSMISIFGRHEQTAFSIFASSLNTEFSAADGAEDGVAARGQGNYGRARLRYGGVRVFEAVSGQGDDDGRGLREVALRGQFPQAPQWARRRPARRKCLPAWAVNGTRPGSPHRSRCQSGRPIGRGPRARAASLPGCRCGWPWQWFPGRGLLRP